MRIVYVVYLVYLGLYWAPLFGEMSYALSISEHVRILVTNSSPKGMH